MPRDASMPKAASLHQFTPRMHVTNGRAFEY